MTQHFLQLETSDHEEGFVEQSEKTLFGPRSRLGMTAVAGAVMLAILVMAECSGSINTQRANPAASIFTADAPCFEENVAYSLGEGKAGQGQASWVIGDEKRDSAHECQIWCQMSVGCEFFTFRRNSKRCLLSTKRGKQRKKGNKGAISGPRLCNVPLQPCQAYTAPPSPWTLERHDGIATFKTQLAGQQVSLTTWASAQGGDWKLGESLVTSPIWPKGAPLPFMALMGYGGSGSLNQREGFNITVDGAPMENVVLMFYHSLPAAYRAQWNATVSEGVWLRVVDSSPWFRSDLLDNGRTIFLDSELWEVALDTWRLSEPVSTISISAASSIPRHDFFGVAMFKGSNCP